MHDLFFSQFLQHNKWFSFPGSCVSCFSFLLFLALSELCFLFLFSSVSCSFISICRLMKMQSGFFFFLTLKTSVFSCDLHQAAVCFISQHCIIINLRPTKISTVQKKFKPLYVDPKKRHKRTHICHSLLLILKMHIPKFCSNKIQRILL